MKLLIIPIALFGVLSLGCKSAPPLTGKLLIEAAIVYSLGGPQPVAREDFLLLKKDASEILREVGVTGDNPQNQMQNLTGSMVLVRFDKKAEERMNAVNAAIQSQVAHKVMTGFDGKAQIDNLPVGSIFYVYAVTPTRGSGYCIWNLKTEIKAGDNHLILDQKNAVYIY